jgi:integrase
MHLRTCRDSEWLFPSPFKSSRFTNAHVSSRHAYDILNDQLDVIKIPRRPFHSLRATCYKMCQKAGWEVRKACELLGDTQRVAEEHYNAPSTGDMKEIANEKPLF